MSQVPPLSSLGPLPDLVDVDQSRLRELTTWLSSSSVLSATPTQRRTLAVTFFAQLLEADVGFWAWGRGHPLKSTIVPIAIIDHGFSDAQRIAVIELGTDKVCNAEFQERAAPLLNATGQLTVTRREIFSDLEWRQRPRFRRYCEQMGMDSWIQSVRYSRGDTWNNMLYFRSSSRGEFGPSERSLLDFIQDAVCWLRPQVEELVPTEAFAGLTPRQKTVMLLLLDGQSRKEIALQLKLAEHTVGEYIKRVYEHFQVHSQGELTALFLKGV
ncbi:helix-turn-helix transcriptional regulator [Planctomicrobium piriforme]|uniref:Regulatory protein, luxR family n=1 Tax=Planctomicrobium piriforme TaxID=1576369 RepID=A0A1I3CK48_9PLAN|nr:LuxR C-terminal-related transcriptional regulator [Planctomicrobium piriforme]SFH74970.1 regulatory protein, luxR family [Planctomicrobium piriforme]